VRHKFGWEPNVIITAQPDTAVDDDGSPGFDIGELLSHDPGEVPWIVQDVLTYGAHLLVGRPKGGKSWITLDMAYACGNAGTFLGKQAKKTGVLWIASEDTKDGLARRLKIRNEKVGGIIVMTSESLKAERAKWDDDCTFDAWLRAFLDAHPGIGLVIIDTLSSVDAKWRNEVIDTKRQASVTDIAYQKSRIYEDMGQETQTCIVLVTHTRKRNGKEITDYHELINEAQTIVAGATASLVLADPPDHDPHNEDDHRRVFATRGRNIINETPLLIELKDARATLLGTFYEIKQTEAQAEVLEAIEAILAEQERTSIAEVAAALGKHKNTVQGALARAAKQPGGLKWKGRELVIKAGKSGGIYWK
jgi:RecA-family ATPase